MFAVVKHGARHPERHAVIGGALLVGDRGAHNPRVHRSALGGEGLGPIPAVAVQAGSQPFLCAVDRDGEVFAAGRVSARGERVLLDGPPWERRLRKSRSPVISLVRGL